jgi:hypothetical protein
MEHRDGFAVRRAQRWRPALVSVVATSLLLLERALLDQMGSPVTLLRALGDFGQPWTDPVASVLAVMALTAETLVGHVLVVLVLGSMGTLPGSMGRLTVRLTSLITPVAARRLLDQLMGSALLAQTALAVPPGTAHEHRWTASYPGATASSPYSAEQALRRLLSPSSPSSPPA